jgi:predicted DNA-binding transcriptional regulator AlpA
MNTSANSLTIVLSPKEVSERLGLSIPTIWRMRRRNDLPEPLRLSPGRIGWRESDIAAWLDSRQAGGR